MVQRKQRERKGERRMYIPDMTERFPEGLDGVDLTDNYFPHERVINYYDIMDCYARDTECYDREIRENKGE